MTTFSYETLIKTYSTAVVKSMYHRIESLRELNHRPTKGELKELFVAEVLENFLTSQFGIGTGVITDYQGNQSKQIDIIIYDKRILPPFVKKLNIGVYPVEAVLTAIEVKTILNKKAIISANESAEHIHENLVLHPKVKDKGFKVLCGIIGFNKEPIKDLRENKGDLLLKYATHLNAVCHVQGYCWIKWLNKKNTNKWRFSPKDEMTFEETKRFIAWTLDATRNKSNMRFSSLTSVYVPWLSSYIRDAGNSNQADSDQESVVVRDD